MNRSAFTRGAFVAVGALVPACHSSDLSGPPAIRLGRDECAACGMLIVEDRHSCALLVQQDGQREYLVFDDPGCLLDHRAGHPEVVAIDTFVHDYATGAWISAGTAYYVADASRGPRTPMGSGIVAFQTRAGAEQQLATSGGQIVTYDGLAAVRRDRREAQRSPLPDAPTP